MSSYGEVAFYNRNVLTDIFYNHLRLHDASVLYFFEICPVRVALKIKCRPKALRVSFSALWKGELILPAAPRSSSEVPRGEQCIRKGTHTYGPRLGPEGHHGEKVPSTDHSRTAPTCTTLYMLSPS